MAGPLDSLLQVLGLGGGAAQPPADPYALAAQLGATQDPTQQAALRKQMQDALAAQQRSARGMGLLQAGIGTIGATTPQGYPAPVGQALGKGFQQGLSGYDQYLDRTRQLQMGLQQAQHMGQQTAQGSQQLQLGQQQLDSNKAVAEWSKQITGMQQGISDPKAIQFLLQARTGKEMAIALQGQATQADAEGKHDVANLLRSAAQVAPASPEKALDILKSTVARPLAPEQIEHYKHLNAMEDASSAFYKNYRGPAATSSEYAKLLSGAQKTIAEMTKPGNEFEKAFGKQWTPTGTADRALTDQLAADSGLAPWPVNVPPRDHWAGMAPGTYAVPTGPDPGAPVIEFYWDGKYAIPIERHGAAIGGSP